MDSKQLKKLIRQYRRNTAKPNFAHIMINIKSYGPFMGDQKYLYEYILNLLSPCSRQNIRTYIHKQAYCNLLHRIFRNQCDAPNRTKKNLG